jgi:hypothetical protein
VNNCRKSTGFRQLAVAHFSLFGRDILKAVEDRSSRGEIIGAPVPPRFVDKLHGLFE